MVLIFIEVVFYTVSVSITLMILTISCWLVILANV